MLSSAVCRPSCASSGQLSSKVALRVALIAWPSNCRSSAIKAWAGAAPARSCSSPSLSAATDKVWPISSCRPAAMRSRSRPCANTASNARRCHCRARSRSLRRPVAGEPAPPSRPAAGVGLGEGRAGRCATAPTRPAAAGPAERCICLARRCNVIAHPVGFRRRASCGRGRWPRPYCRIEIAPLPFKHPKPARRVRRGAGLLPQAIGDVKGIGPMQGFFPGSHP